MMENALFENVFVFITLMFSGGFIFRRMHRMSQAGKRRQSACSSCSSGTCTPVMPRVAEQGETPLPLR